MFGDLLQCSSWINTVDCHSYRFSYRVCIQVRYLHGPTLSLPLRGLSPVKRINDKFMYMDLSHINNLASLLAS